MRIPSSIKVLAAYGAVVSPLFVASAAFAATPEGATQVQNFMQNMINMVAGLAGTAAAGGVVWSGIMYIAAGGNLQHVERAKSIFKYSMLGLVLCLAAFAISNLVGSQASSAFGK